MVSFVPPVLLVLAATFYASPVLARPAPSSMEFVTYVPSDLTPGKTFYASLVAALAAKDGRSVIPSDVFLSLLPIGGDDRDRLLRQYPEPFSIKCVGDLCSFYAKGTATTAELALSSSKTATVEIGPTITGFFMALPGQGVELCHVKGITVKKWFVSKRVQGIQLLDSEHSGKMLFAVGEEPVGQCPSSSIQRLNRQNQDLSDPSESHRSVAMAQ